MQTKNSTAKIFLTTVVLLLLLIGAGYLYMHRNGNSQINNTNDVANNVTGEPNTTPRGNEPSPTTPPTPPKSGHNEVPSKLLLTVPFTPQAPTANWDELHNEGCEEASAIIANAYYENISSLPPAIVEREISKLTKWQQDNFGYNLSITTEETVKMVEANYALDAEIVPMNEQTIKQALADNKLIMFPANGQMLGNPYFKSPGPIYHMLVLIGFDGHTIITNDPGTKRGAGFKYQYSTLEAANGNWNHADHKVNLDDKKIIIVSKK